MSGLVPAFVLHRRLYKESSLLVDVLTETQGRIHVVARGARRPQSRWRAILHAFTPLAIRWRGRGQVFTLIHAESQGQAYYFTGRRLACGFYINELLVRLLHSHDPHPQLFYDYIHVLDRIFADEQLSPGLRWFECRLLAELGYGLNLDYDVTGRPLQPQAYYHYEVGRGFILTKDTEAKGVFSGIHLIDLRNNHLPTREHCMAAQRLLKRALGHILGDKPIYSRQLV